MAWKDKGGLATGGGLQQGHCLVSDRKKGRRVQRAPRPSTAGMRTCVGCRKRHPRAALARLVCSPQGEVLVDRHLKAPGRGAHLCYDPACVELAVSRQSLPRAFRRAVQAVEWETLVMALVEAVDRRIEDALRIGRPAGWIVSGADVLDREVDRLQLLVVAGDASAGTAARLARLAERAECSRHVFGDRLRLGATQGRTLLAAVGIVGEPLAVRVAEELSRLERLRAESAKACAGLRHEVENQ